VSTLFDAEDDLERTLESTFPSTAHTSALAALAQFRALLYAADTNGNVVLAAKFLSAGVKSYGKAQKLVMKSVDAPAPLAQITADVSGALHSSIKTVGAA